MRIFERHERTENGVVNIHVDFDLLKATALQGVTRAAGFLGYMVNTTAGEPPKSVRLPGIFAIQILPEPLPANLAQEVQQQYRLWTIGNCLAELDQFYARFVDALWDSCQYAESDRRRDRFVRNPIGAKSSSAKHQRLLEHIDAYDDDAKGWKECLFSMTQTRNCLLHDSGLVSKRATQDANELVIRWYRLTAKLVYADGFEVIMNDVHVAPPARQFSADATAELQETEMRIPVGNLIELAPTQLQEICFFYYILIEKTWVDVLRYFVKLGYLTPPVGPAAPTASSPA